MFRKKKESDIVRLESVQVLYLIDRWLGNDPTTRDQYDEINRRVIVFISCFFVSMSFHNFDRLMVKLASPEQIAKRSPHGSVDSPDTINYRTGKPKHKGLFCESIFGPVKNFECSCGKYK